MISLKKFIHRIACVGLFFWANATVSAQNYWFKNVGLAEGLSSSQVNTIFKDSKGFVWFGTSAGLDCYDGADIRQYQSNYSLSSALPDSYIVSIQEGNNGKIWVKTSGGYVVFDPETQTFDRSVAQHLSMLDANIDPEIVYYDRWQNLWVYDQGKAVYYYKAKQELVYTFRFDDSKNGLREGTICHIGECNEGILAVYTNGTVCCISGEQQKILWYNDIITKNNPQEDEYKVFGDIDGNICVYGDAHSYFYEKSARRWYRSISELAQAWGSDVNVGNDLVTGVAGDSKGNVWISTDRHGLLLLNPSQRAFKAHLRAGADRGLLSDNLQTVYVDDTDLLWVGSFRTGVSYYAPNLYLFDVKNVGDVYGISEDIHNGLWFATHDRGLVYLNPSDGFSTNYTTANGLNDNILSCVLAASDGTIWAGSNRFGLNRLSSAGINVIQHNSGSQGGLKDNNIQDLAEDRFGNIWIATRKGGLQCLNPKTGKFSNFCMQNGKLQSDNVTSVSTSGTNLVAGTTNGIIYLNLSSNKVMNYTGTASGDKHFTSNVVTRVFLDSRGLIWIGTRDGLNVLDPTLDQLNLFYTTEGLLSNFICGIAEDKNHDVWVTTTKGVNRISVQNVSTENSRFAFNFYGYGVSDGLQGVEFNEGAIATTRGGKIYMGGQNGINWLRNIENKERKRTLNVLLSNLTIDGQPISVGESYNGSVILEKALNSISTLKLRSSDKDICITLGTDDYNHAEPARFIYQLEGVNDAWLPVTGDGHTLKLFYLSSGKYKLHIKAMLDDGKTVSEEHLLNIVVQKPWYLRWYMFVLVGLLFVLFVYAIYRLWPYVVGYYQQRRRELGVLKKRQEEIENVAQDVRSNVVSMIPQLGLLQMETTNAEHKEVLNGLHHSARQMLVALNRLKENNTTMVSDAGVDAITQQLPASDGDVMIGDDGPVDGGGLIGDDFLVSDEGIISTNGMPVNTSGTKQTVYVVDRDKDMLEFVADCLKGAFIIRTFTSTEECWNTLADSRPSVLMCAENMPGMSGSELCEKIKNERTYERIPFILTTDGVMTQAEITMKKITLLADDYIPSPYNLQTVIARIHRQLDEPMGDVVADDTMRGADAMSNAVNTQIRQLLDQYIIQNISKKDLSIEEMSKVLGVSRTVLFRKVEHITNLSPTEYIRVLRLEESARLLESGYLSPAEVAQELGFGNLSTFSRFFQAQYGVLPSQYAEEKRGKR